MRGQDVQRRADAGQRQQVPGFAAPARTNATCSLTSGASSAAAQAASWVTRTGSSGSAPPRESRTPCGTTATPRPRSSATPRGRATGARPAPQRFRDHLAEPQSGKVVDGAGDGRAPADPDPATARAAPGPPVVARRAATPRSSPPRGGLLVGVAGLSHPSVSATAAAHPHRSRRHHPRSCCRSWIRRPSHRRDANPNDPDAARCAASSVANAGSAVHSAPTPKTPTASAAPDGP